MTTGNETEQGGRGGWVGIARAALPLFTTMVASAGAPVDTALLRSHATATLAAFAVAVAVFSPATGTVAGALRGVAPFVTRRREDADGSCRWLAVAVGTVGALAVVSVRSRGGKPRWRGAHSTHSAMRAGPAGISASVTLSGQATA